MVYWRQLLLHLLVLQWDLSKPIFNDQVFMEKKILLTTGVVETNRAAARNLLYISWLGGLITLKIIFQLFYGRSCLIYPTIPELQWNTGVVTAQKYQMAKS